MHVLIYKLYTTITKHIHKNGQCKDLIDIPLKKTYN